MYQDVLGTCIEPDVCDFPIEHAPCMQTMQTKDFSCLPHRHNFYHFHHLHFGFLEKSFSQAIAGFFISNKFIQLLGVQPSTCCDPLLVIQVVKMIFIGSKNECSITFFGDTHAPPRKFHTSLGLQSSPLCEMPLIQSQHLKCLGHFREAIWVDRRDTDFSTTQTLFNEKSQVPTTQSPVVFVLFPDLNSQTSRTKKKIQQISQGSQAASSNTQIKYTPSQTLKER